MEQANAHAVPLEHLDQADLGLVELPARGDEAAVLVGIGIAEHHLLLAAEIVDEAAVFGNGEQPVHHADAGAQVVDRLEQRDHVERGPPVGADEPDLLEQQRELQHVRDALGLGDDAGADRVGAVGLADRRGGAEQREFARRLLAIGEKRRDERARRAQFAQQQRDARLFVRARDIRRRASPRRRVRRRCARARRSSGADRAGRDESRRRRRRGAARAGGRAREWRRRWPRANGRWFRDRRSSSAALA